MLHSRPTSSPNLLSPSFPFCIFSLCPLTTVPCSCLSFCASCILSPLTPLEFLNGMLDVFEPGALNYSTFSRPIPLILSVSKNPILTHHPLSGFLDSLLCVLIAPTPSLAFSLVMPRTLAAVSSFLSGRVYLSLNFLPHLFLRLIPTPIMQGSTFFFTTPPCFVFLMCTPPYSFFFDRWKNRFLFFFHCYLLQKSLHSGGLQLPSPPMGLKSYLRPPLEGGIQLGHLF